ncbi:hypothetical protein D3C81_2170330 [compost metagenome]
MDIHVHEVIPLQHPLLNLYDIVGFCDAKTVGTTDGMPTAQHFHAFGRSTLSFEKTLDHGVTIFRTDRPTDHE